MRACLIGVALAAFAGAAGAQPAAVPQSNQTTCELWSKTRRAWREKDQPGATLDTLTLANVSLIAQSWVLGFVASYNDYARTGQTISASDEAISAWVDDYCVTYPQDSLDTASRHLVEAMKASR